MCTPCNQTSSPPAKEEVTAATSSLTSTLSSATKRVMRLPLGSRKKKKAKSQTADAVVPVTLSPGANGDAIYGSNMVQTCPAIPGTKPVTPTPSVYGDVHHSNSFSPHYAVNGHPHQYQPHPSHPNDSYMYNMLGGGHQHQQRRHHNNTSNRRLPAAFFCPTLASCSPQHQPQP